VYALSVSELGGANLSRYIPTYSTITNSSTTSLVVFSLPLMLSRGIWILMENTDNILIGILLSGAEVGVYDAAFTIGRLFFIATGAVGVLFVPVFSDLHRQDNKVEMRRFYHFTTKWVGFAALLPFLTIVSMTDKIILILFSPEYLEGTMALAIVSTGLFLHAATGLNSGAIKASGDSRNILIGNMIGYITNILLNFILIPEFGIAGAAAASLCSFAILNIYRLYILYDRLQITPFSKLYAYPLIASAVVSGGIIFLFNESIGWASIGIAAMTHITIVVRFGMSEEDKRFIKERKESFVSSD
jgi:O-antigen/teichoic acid export membrane protein